MKLDVAALTSPIGSVWLAATERGVCALGIGAGAERILMPQLIRRFGEVRVTPSRDPHRAISRLEAYFGRAAALDDVPLDLGGTQFQAGVWRLLRAVPAGQTVSYSDLAARAGIPRAFRAVARANATNPVSLFVPCHRVIGKTGDLRGYAWGPARKEWLLRHEASAAPRP
jgi:O-6-methylguanine DNA methyltransferase